MRDELCERRAESGGRRRKEKQHNFLTPKLINSSTYKLLMNKFICIFVDEFICKINVMINILTSKLLNLYTSKLFITSSPLFFYAFLSVKLKVLPFLIMLFKLTVCLCASIICFTIARPRPVPPRFRDLLRSTR